MMPGNWQIREKEPVAPRKAVDPRKHSLYRRRLIDAEARLVLPSDVARVFERLETSFTHDGLHPEIIEAARVKHRSPVPKRHEHSRERRAPRGGIVRRRRVECGEPR